MPRDAPCLYAAAGRWYIDCIDGKRLKILKLAIGAAADQPAGAAAGLVDTAAHIDLNVTDPRGLS